MRRTRLLLATVITATLLIGAAPGAVGEHRQPGTAGVAHANRAAWVWQEVAPRVLARFAAEHRLSSVWLATSTDPSRAEHTRVAKTARQLATLDTSLVALGGSPRWGTHPAWAVEWASAALRLPGIRAVHLDVEPYALKRWHGDRQRVIRLYLSMLDQVAALPGPLNVDVPFWYGTIRTHGRTLADDVLDRVDAVTVMSYRDQAVGPNSIVDVSRDWLRRAAKANVPVRLGAETNRLPRCEHCTFYEEGEAALLRAQSRVVDQLGRAAAFSGVAVHDYAGWSALAGR